MKLLYFAWLRTKIGIAEERVAVPDGVTDVAGLIGWLRDRGDGYAEALANLDVVKVAVNQEYVPLTHPVAAGDEVALFPPVTGG
ncbi:molybdopterin converting factor subunit 1 [Niveispirillum cyanobacteriorum]|uniref:Molybdopterin synthase sulfur carrier subunit n=1 Tax=Niveispirillum cyanobacteriorum TaxID=1612173 RepID=A0A2K9NEN2_9PROT|nr:molybdopterin converting factor subunit 1 [Niveispirillum cyanobacteriorum]AUN31601.1 molybdopterin converting factor subunit 1 [Niveispirillum cyanobacteriorum]